ncbi:MAG TPA: N-acetylmuramoyl-L-alanine amidase [Chloroflexota bacterium]|nr:N-acetylmuramoyl-L-alanine amidase [Chloroflexota bacterium]
MSIVHLRSRATSRLAMALGVSALTLALVGGPTGWGSQKAYAQEVAPSVVAVSDASTPTPIQRFLGMVDHSGATADNARGSSTQTDDGSSRAASAAPQGSDQTAPPATAPAPVSPPPVSAAAPASSPAASQAASPLPTAAGKHVGIQAGHWQTANLPSELAALRTSTGAAGSGWKEVDVNLDIAQRVTALLTNAGVQVDLLPSTIPVGYKADAFVALHNDGNANTGLTGYKVARSAWSVITTKDDVLVKDLATDYEAGTGFTPNPQTITVNMTHYYAFNNRTYQHSVAPSTPAAILEMSFLTNAKDRNEMVNDPNRVATAIARGILDFLNGK